MHEMFLCRLAAHPVFRNDQYFQTFLQYEQDVNLLSLFKFFFVAFSSRKKQKRNGRISF